MYKYYLKNIHWGLIIFGIAVYLTRDDFNEAKTKIFLVISFFNCLLFPFAKRTTEMLALKYSTRESWSTGFYTETSMKNGVYAIYYMAVFIAAIPASVAYLLYLLTRKKTACSRR
jgi:uncharacterized membrane protein